ncbi:hypothetical protein V8C35DRAFT_309113 [Trichoderma chlorosporum]
MLPRHSIYSEAVFPPQDIYYEGSEDEDYDDAEARRQRYEAAGQRFLAGRVPMLLSAALKGPFEEESGWVNPWRSKNRTAHSRHRPEPQPVRAQCSLRRTALSASASPIAQRQAKEVLKNAECALPSPESLKQAPFTEARSHLQGKVSSLNDWRDDDASVSSTKDGYDSWVASTPSRRLSKRKSKSSLEMDSASKKRRMAEQSENLEPQTPTSGRRQAETTNDGKQRTKAHLQSSSIYSHIRELTSKLPRQDLSSEEGDPFDSDNSEAHTTPPLAASSSTHMLHPSSSLSSPFSQPSLLRALSPVSISPVQTPTKQSVTVSQSPSHPRSSSGVSCLSEAPTNLTELTDLEMLGMGRNGDDNVHADDNASVSEYTTASEFCSGEEELPLPQAPGVSEGDHINDPHSVPQGTFPVGSDYNEPTSAPDNAITTRNAKGGFMDGLEANYEIPHGFISPFRVTPPARISHPIIYDDAEGSDASPPNSSITPLSSAQQPAASQSEASNTSRDVSSDDTPTKINSPLKPSALQSLSPRNGRINSRPALQKIAQPCISSPLKPIATDKALHLQKEDSQQSKENAESKEARQNQSPKLVKTNLAISHPYSSGIATDSSCKADRLKVDKAQEESPARDSVVPSTTAVSSLLPIEAASPTEMNSKVESSVLPNTPELQEPTITQQEVTTDSQLQLPIEKSTGPSRFEMCTTKDTSEKANEPDLTAILADDHGETRQEAQDGQTLTPNEASECLVLPPQGINMQQPSGEILPPPALPVSRRASTPEPQFAFTSFSSFMSPSPSHRRQIRYPFDGVAPTSHGILVSSKSRAWRSTAAKKQVSWAPLPHEETDGSGQKISSETDTSSSLSRGRDRAVSPPPPASTGLASDSLTDRDMKFGDHFAAVADRSRGTQPQSVPTASGHGSCSPGLRAPVTAAQIAGPTESTSTPKVNGHRGVKGGAKASSSGWDDDNDPTDIVQDIFNEMDDFLQVWDVDAELDEARKAEKARAAADKKKDETLSDLDMDMGMGMDIAAQFF